MYVHNIYIYTQYFIKISDRVNLIVFLLTNIKYKVIFSSTRKVV